jgi:hypothetical protein
MMWAAVQSGERKTDCVVKSRRSAGVMAPVSLVSIKGYLVAQTAEALWVFNTTGIARCDLLPLLLGRRDTPPPNEGERHRGTQQADAQTSSPGRSLARRGVWVSWASLLTRAWVGGGERCLG